MQNWTDGYIADIGYTYGYYAELNPLRVNLALLNAGWAVPKFATACELGFGQGISINIHAAASETQWYGTDFNPAQAGFARELAAACGSGAQLYADSFAEFEQRTDLPDFDYIGLHGIWSWISPENCRVIVDFIRRKLNVGGVLYISYNTFPGWASFAPVQHLMKLHNDVHGQPGPNILKRIDSAIDFTDQWLATNPGYANANPQAVSRLKKLRELNRNYLAHEYFNRNWNPMYFSEVVEWLAPARLDYACSAHYLDHIDAVNLTAERQAFLKEISDPIFRESVRDFMVNQQFRRDYWVKGARKLSHVEHGEALRRQKLMLVSFRPDISLKVKGFLGEATMNEAIYNPILDFLADYKQVTLAEIEQAFQDKGISLSQIMQAVMILASAGHLVSVQDNAVMVKAKPMTEKLNKSIIDKARDSSEINVLASPVTGSGFSIGRFQQLFLLAHNQGIEPHPSVYAAMVWQILAAEGQKIIKEGKLLESAEENLAELTVQATLFFEKQLPLLKALQIA